MEVSFMHLAAIALTILATIGVAVYSARGVNSAAGFSLSGRKATAPRVAGSIAGVIIGGGATVGTAQMAFQVGLAGWAYALGAGLAFFVMGLFYAKPLRRTGLETLPQFFTLHYGKWAGVMVGVATILSHFSIAGNYCSYPDFYSGIRHYSGSIFRAFRFGCCSYCVFQRSEGK